MKNNKTCRVCDSTDFVLEAAGVKPNLSNIPGIFDFARCRECNHVTIDPVPREEELNKFYERLPLSDRRCTSAKRPIQMWQKLSDPSYERILSLVPKGRVLDVGCGRGDLLQAIATPLRCVEGVDFDTAAVDEARKRGLNVRWEDIDTFVPQAKVYDAVIMRHVLEHIRDPIQVLKNLSVGLVSGGRIIIEVPNLDGLARKIFRHDWNGWDPPFHLNQFTRGSLIQTLRRSGYSFEKLVTLGIVDEYRRSYMRAVKKEGRHDALRLVVLPLALLSGRLGFGGALLAVGINDG